jgi:hypothetical protein
MPLLNGNGNGVHAPAGNASHLPSEPEFEQAYQGILHD